MTKDEMDAAIRAAVRSAIPDVSATLHWPVRPEERAIFLSGMRAAVDLIGNPSKVHREQVHAAADKLERGNG